MYKVVFAHLHESEMYLRRTVDSEQLAKLFNRPTQIAKADRCFDWGSTPSMVLQKRFVDRIFREEANRVKKEIFGSV